MHRMYNSDHEKEIALNLIKDNDLLNFFKENYELEDPNEIYKFLENEENIKAIMEYIESGDNPN